MKREELHALIISQLADRLVRLGVEEHELGNGFDLVRSGLLDSLGYIDLVASLEQATGKQVDLEQALETGEATTLNGLYQLFQ